MKKLLHKTDTRSNNNNSNDDNANDNSNSNNALVLTQTIATLVPISGAAPHNVLAPTSCIDNEERTSIDICLQCAGAPTTINLQLIALIAQTVLVTTLIVIREPLGEIFDFGFFLLIVSRLHSDGPVRNYTWRDLFFSFWFLIEISFQARRGYTRSSLSILCFFHHRVHLFFASRCALRSPPLHWFLARRLIITRRTPGALLCFNSGRSPVERRYFSLQLLARMYTWTAGILLERRTETQERNKKVGMRSVLSCYIFL